MSISGLAKLTASSSPPTKKFSFPTLAPITPPVTGASIILIPLFFASLPNNSDVSISIVEQSIINPFFEILSIIPCSPKKSDFTCLPSGSIDIIKFASSSTSSKVSTTSKFASFAFFIISCDTSYAFTFLPAFTN